MIFSNQGSIRTNSENDYGAVVKDLLYYDPTDNRFKPRTSTLQRIEGIVMETYNGPYGDPQMTVIVANGAFEKHTSTWGLGGLGSYLYEDTSNPSKMTVSTGGRLIGRVGHFNGSAAQNTDTWTIWCFDTANGVQSSGGSGGGLTFKAGSRAITLDLTSNSANVQTYAHGLGTTPTKLSGFLKLPQQGASPAEQGMLPVSCDMSGNYIGKQTHLDTSATRLNVGLIGWGLWCIAPDNGLNNPDGAEIRWSQERYITVTADATNVYFTRNANGGMSNPSFPNATTARLYFDLE